MGEQIAQNPTEMHRWVPWAMVVGCPRGMQKEKRTNNKQRTTNIAGGSNDESE